MKRIIMLSVFVVALTACTALAETGTMLDFTGFLYESDNTPGEVGFPPSNVGDVLAGLGFIESVNPILGWSLDDYEITIMISDLVSGGEIPAGGGMVYIMYTGGTIDIVADRRADAGFTAADYGVEPPNATAPATFGDGTIYLHGVFTSFYMTYHPTLHAGSFEGYMSWVSGSELGSMHAPAEGYTFAGTVDPYGAMVPDGYDLEQVGHITFDSVIPTEPGTWGQVKNLYR